MKDPVISVIVPIYNEEKYLETCLNSIVNQSFEELEIICVNDGSNDKSLDIIEKYANSDDRFRIINQENHGLGYSRTIGMRVAKGKYIGFVDADDYIDKDFYLRLYVQAEKYNADLVRGLHMFDTGKFCYEHEINKRIRTKSLEEETLDFNDHSVVVWNAIYKKDFLIKYKILYFDDILYEDIPFTTRITLCSKKSAPALGIYVKNVADNKINRLGDITQQKLDVFFKANIIATDYLNKIPLSKNDYMVVYKRTLKRLLKFIKRINKIEVKDCFINNKFDYFINNCKYKAEMLKNFNLIK